MDSLLQEKRRLEAELRTAGSLSTARQIKAELSQVTKQIERLRHEDQQRHDPNGRRADLAYLEERKKGATHGQLRDINEAQRKIRAQAYDRTTNRLREEMIRAKRRGDNDEFAAIQEHMERRG